METGHSAGLTKTLYTSVQVIDPEGKFMHNESTGSICSGTLKFWKPPVNGVDFNAITDITSIIAWKALGRDCTNNNGVILQIGVLSS